jgi:hypothetical protein
MDESHSDINSAFGPHRSVSSQFGDHHLLSSLLEIKNDLSTEVRALTKRMSHIDQQISQIFNFLSPLNTSVTNNFSTDAITDQSPLSRIPSPPLQMPASPPLAPPLSPLAPAILPETNVSSVSISPLFEAPSFFSDLHSKVTLYDNSQPLSPGTDVYDLSRQSRTSEQIMTTPPLRQISRRDSGTLSIPPPPSIYNRSTSSSITSLGASTTSRSSISNKIAPAPVPSSPVSPKHQLSSTFQPISNTRFNPGRSPKPKTRSHHGRISNKHQPKYPEKSTVLELESPVQQDTPSKNVPLLPTPGKATPPTAKSSSNVFRRFITGGNNTEKTGISSSSSSTLLYPRTSDDERPMSPASSGNEDDDYRPLTSASSKYHHQTPL